MKKIILILMMTFFMNVSTFATIKNQITSVGAIAIEPCQSASILANWYQKFGIETTQVGEGYYGQIETTSGSFIFGIHPYNPQNKCSSNISVIYKVENFEESLESLRLNAIVPVSTVTDSQGNFASFKDPDGNNITIWGE